MGERVNEMLLNALEAICGALNAHMQHLNAGDVVLTSLTDSDGAPNPDARDKIVLCLGNLFPEATVNSPRAVPDDATAIPTLHVSADILVMSNFVGSRYCEGLDALSQVIRFFHQSPVFSRSSTPKLDPPIEKLTVELLSLNASEIKDVIAMHGGRYLPALVYRIRSLPFAPDLPAKPIFAAG